MSKLFETSKMKRSAGISPCGQYRYWLRRDWDSEKPCLGFIMLNPSTADANVDDPTIRKCIYFARRDGFGSIHVCNLFALRATDPDSIWVHPNPIVLENFDAMRVLERLADTVVVAWGKSGGKRAHIHAVRVATFISRSVKLVCLGLNGDGSPKHPLYLRNDTPFVPVMADFLGRS